MKRTFQRALLPLLLAAALVPVQAQQSSLLTEAQRAYTAGNHEEAKQKFEQVLAGDPKNLVASRYLKMIAAQEKKVSPAGKLRDELKKLILPHVDFKEATLNSSLDYLRQQAEKISGGKIKTSFVLQPGVDGSTPVTLRLNNVPFTEVLRYVSDLAKVQFSIEQYAITVKPLSSGAAEAIKEVNPGVDAPVMP